AAVAARLEPQEAASLCAQATRPLTEAMNKNTEPYALWVLAQGLAEVAARLEPQEAAKHYAQETRTLILLLSKFKSPQDRSESAKVEQRLSGLLSGDPRHPAACAAGLVATVQAAQYGQPLLAPIVHVPGLEPLHCRLSTPELVDLLKHPL